MEVISGPARGRAGRFPGLPSGGWGITIRGSETGGWHVSSGRSAPVHAVSIYGSVAQLDRALASGARGRAFESRRAHSGSSSPADISVLAGLCVSGCTFSGVTFRVTKPAFPSRSLSASRFCSTHYSGSSWGWRLPCYLEQAPAESDPRGDDSRRQPRSLSRVEQAV